MKGSQLFAILRFFVSSRLELESSFNRQDAKTLRRAKNLVGYLEEAP